MGWEWGTLYDRAGFAATGIDEMGFYEGMGMIYYLENHDFRLI